MGEIQVPTSHFMQRERMYKMGKSSGKDWNISRLQISGKQIFLSAEYRVGLT